MAIRRFADSLVDEGRKLCYSVVSSILFSECTMAALILRLSNETVVSLPADLAQRAGWQEGTPLQAVVSDRGLELYPAGQVLPYVADWPIRLAQLRERAASLGLYEPDRRDEEYWQIVSPLMEELDHELYA